MKMLRFTVIILAQALLVTAARADVWMVRASGSIGCQVRDTLAALPNGGDSGKLPEECSRLYDGERLIEQPRPGVGFDDFVLVQRADGSQVFVRNDALAADPGIGSISDDRP